MGAAAPGALLVTGSPAGPPQGVGAGSSGAEPRQLLEVAEELAREAGALLLRRYEGDRGEGVAMKSTPTDLVSEADRASERMIVERLAQLRPADGVLGEEGAGSEGESGLRWVVDPLDGTVNYLFGIPQWCVSIAVQDAAGATLAGAVFDPCRGEMWSARADGPATCNGEPVAGSRREDLASAMVATGFGYDARIRAAQARIADDLIPRVRDIRRLGSAALDLAWTAAGRYDAYYERGVKIWDVAAGMLICERAGLASAELAPEGGQPAGVIVAAPALLAALLAIVG